jgi:hypothetical protein
VKFGLQKLLWFWNKLWLAIGTKRMPKTRLYIECPNCHMQYLLKEIALTYSNGAYIENVAGAPEWQRLLCPCRPDTPYKFKLSETMRLKVFSADESEHTHFLTNKKKPPASGS